jgi:hypothetical protein
VGGTHSLAGGRGGGSQFGRLNRNSDTPHTVIPLRFALLGDNCEENNFSKDDFRFLKKYLIYGHALVPPPPAEDVPRDELVYNIDEGGTPGQTGFEAQRWQARLPVLYSVYCMDT